MKNTIVCNCLFSVLLSCLLGCSDKNKNGKQTETNREPNREPKAVAVPTAVRNTIGELHAFRDAELLPLAKQLVNNKLPYPGINDRFGENRKAIFALIGTNKLLLIIFMDQFHPFDPDICASGEIGTDQNAYIHVYVPAVKKFFDSANRDAPKWRQAFSSFLIIGWIHELEHLRYNAAIKAVDLEEEKRTWADTCRYTIVPLVDEYHAPLLQTDGAFYDAWRRAGKNPNNPEWEKFIATRYGDTIGKR